MFKSLVQKLGFGDRKIDSKPKHRIIVSIPSTRYDSITNIKETNKINNKNNNNNNNNDIKSKKIKVKSKKKIKDIIPSLNSSLPLPSKIVKRRSAPNNKDIKHVKTKTRSRTPKRKKNRKNKNDNSGIISDNIDDTNDDNIDKMKKCFIYPTFDILKKNNGLKFEITVQYQKQMWTVYKTLTEFIELYNILYSKYNNKIFKDIVINKRSKQKQTKKIEIPPLMPIGLFYMYFDKRYNGSINETNNLNNNNSNNNSEYDINSNKKPTHVYKQIYNYHQQQVIMQQKQELNMKRQEQQMRQARQAKYQKHIQMKKHLEGKQDNDSNKNNSDINEGTPNNKTKKGSLSEVSGNIVNKYQEHKQNITFNNMGQLLYVLLFNVYMLYGCYYMFSLVIMKVILRI